MLDRELLERLAELTGALKPGQGVATEDLREARRLLALVFLREGSEAVVQGPQATEVEEKASPPSSFEGLPQDVIAELESAATDAEHSHLAATEAEWDHDDWGVRVFRRTLPVHTSTVADSLPLWAAGRRIERTLGPFLDENGRPIWFDVYLPEQHVSVVRDPSPTPILQLPLRAFIFGSSSTTEYEVTAGSIWIRSELITPSAPSGAYTGLRVKGGSLSLSSEAKVIAGTVHIDAMTTVTLAVEFAAPAPATPTTGPGADAGDVMSETPATATFVFTVGNCQVLAADNALARIYDNELELTKASATPQFDALVNRILVPFETSTPGIKIAMVKSNLFRPSGTAPIEAVAWALPVTVSDVASLGEAAGTGALLARTGSGLHATWRGLSSSVLIGAVFMVEPGRLVVASEMASGPGVLQTLLLWNEDAAGIRRSQIELRYYRPFTLRFFSESGANEAVFARCEATASLDRPLCSDGMRLAVRFQEANVTFLEGAAGFLVLLRAVAHPGSSQPVSLALTNGLLTTTNATRLVLSGRMVDEKRVDAGVVQLNSGLLHLLPFLPDPYITNIASPRPPQINDRTGSTAALELSSPEIVGALITDVRWPQPDDSNLSFRLSVLPGGLPNPMKPPNSGGPAQGETDSFGNENGDIKQILADDSEHIAGLRTLFEDVAGPAKESLFLLDVSTNADQLGVGLGFTVADQDSPPSDQPLTIRDVSIVTEGCNIRLFTTPLIQWEPVVTDPNPGSFPSPLYSGGDGGPTTIGANSVTFVPVAPVPLLAQLVDEFNNEPDKPVAALFTLPFGMLAVAKLRKPSFADGPGAELGLNQPQTLDGAFKGGLQVAVHAISPSVGPDVESPSFEGATVQTRNAIDRVTQAPLGKSVLSGVHPHTDVAAIFNREMAPPKGARKRVPVTRIDFSGYGASLFSNWYNPRARFAETSQVRFDVIIGRTSYEVVQVKSILFPWGVPVVRTITIDRRKEGHVLRRDSGWVAVGPGLYDFTAPPGGTPGRDPIVSHPGLVKGAYDVRRIRETGRAYEKRSGDHMVVLAEVRFDADIDIEGVVAGQGSGGRVPSREQVGFVQIEPVGVPLSAHAFEQLLADEGPLGGPVDCVIDVGGSGQLMKVARVDVGAAPSVGRRPPEFAAACRGGLQFPSDGAWSVVRHDLAIAEPQPVDVDAGTPLIYEGAAGLPSPPSPLYRFSDPADLLFEANPRVEYAIMQSGSAHRILYPRPEIRKGERLIKSPRRAVLVDMYALMDRIGALPSRAVCFESTEPFELEIRSDGHYSQHPKVLKFAVPPALSERELAANSSFRIFARYPSDPSGITFTLDPDDPVVWSVREEGVYVGMDLGQFTDIMGTRATFAADSATVPQLMHPEVIYNPPLSVVVRPVLKFIDKLGLGGAFSVSMSNPNPRLKAAVQVNIIDPSTADGYITLGAIKVKGQIGAGHGNDPNMLPEEFLLDTGRSRRVAESWAVTHGRWHGYLWITLGIEVQIVPGVYGGGEVKIHLGGNLATGSKTQYMVKWGGSLGAGLGGVLAVEGRFYWGIVAETGDGLLGLGLLVGVSGTASVLRGLVSVTVRLEFMALIERVNGKTFGVGQATFATEITICWFLTISFGVEIQYREEFDL